MVGVAQQDDLGIVIWISVMIITKDLHHSFVVWISVMNITKDFYRLTGSVGELTTGFTVHRHRENIWMYKFFSEIIFSTLLQ